MTDTRLSVWLAQGNLVEASGWAAQTMLSPHVSSPLRTEEVLMRVRVLLAQQQYALAVEQLQRWSQHLDRPGDISTALEWMALCVVALHYADKREQAVRVAVRLLALTEPEGYIRVYQDAGEPMKQVLQTLLEASYFFSSRRRHTRFKCDWSSDVCSSDLMIRRPLRSTLFTHTPQRPNNLPRLHPIRGSKRPLLRQLSLGERQNIPPRHHHRRQIGRASCRERV